MIYLGAMGWSYDYWPIYNDASSSEFLSRYAEDFNSVEVNSTFYRIPRKSSVATWYKQTPEGFRFSVKVPRSISHSKDLDYDIEKLDVFLDHIKPLGEKLGPLLLQLPPKLTPRVTEKVDLILNQLKYYRTAVEFRHKDWFTETTYNLLREYNAALVYFENSLRLSEEVVTADFKYIRLEGDRHEVYGEKGIVERDRSEDNSNLASKLTNIEQDAYIYVSKFYSGYPPSDIHLMASILRAARI